MEDLSGRIFKGYELRELIGKGGFGVVYRAHQQVIERDVAIKIILPDYANHPLFIRRFETEARLVARLEHPHIVPLFDYWRGPEGVFLVMRWLRGGNLRATLRGEPLSIADTARILDQIASALAVAHRHNVIHRDLKPDNILLDEDQNAYLADFGIAKDLTTTDHYTRTGSVVGSPAYLSPEQVRAEPVTPQSDLYALGIMLYELLTGYHPFPDMPATALISAHLNNPIPLLNVHRPDIPLALNGIVQRATAKRPGDRYPDAVSMAAAFREAAAGADEAPTAPRISSRPAAAPSEAVTASALDFAVAETYVDARPELSDQGTLHPGSLEAHLCATIHDVPHLPRRLVGRAELINEVLALLENGERVLLQGLGGMGKTTVAAAVAAERVTTGQEPVVWLEAGTADANTLLDALARAFGAQNAITGATTNSRVQTIRDLLAGQRALVVLDNVWNERALFHVVKAIPRNMPLLVTSRFAIPLDGVIVNVNELSPDDAVELLAYHARQDYHEDGGARALCQTLGFHPFAVQIAGSRIKVQRRLTPSALLRRIADAPHDLKMPGSFAEIGREGIKDLLDESINELDDDTRAVFTGMGAMFAPIATVELLARALGQDDTVIEDALAELERLGLVMELGFDTDDAPGCYRIHDLTYSYAQAAFKETGGDRRAIIAAIVGFVSDHAQDYDCLSLEQNNLLGAAKAARRAGDNETLIGIMEVLATAGYIDVRGHTLPLLELLDSAIEAVRGMGRLETLHYMLGKRGNAYADRGNLDDAFKAYKEALATAPNPNREAILSSVIGTVRVRQGEDDAGDYFERAYDIAKANADDIALSVVLEHRGYQAHVTGELETAHGFYTECVEVAERLQDTTRLFYALFNLGAIEGDMGRHENALATHQRVYQIAKDGENYPWMAHALHVIGEDYHAMDEREQAQTYFNKALALYRDIGATEMVDEVTTLMEAEDYTLQTEA